MHTENVAYKVQRKVGVFILIVTKTYGIWNSIYVLSTRSADQVTPYLPQSPEMAYTGEEFSKECLLRVDFT